MLFFVEAGARIATCFKRYRREFIEVFPSGRGVESATLGKYPSQVADTKDREVEKQILFVSGGDASKIDDIAKMTLWRYLFILNEKLKPRKESNTFGTQKKP